MSKNDKVHITVSGPENSGKTTIARIVANALKQLGFIVENMDPDCNRRNQGLFPIEAERIHRVFRGREVKVLVAQVSRKPAIPAPRPEVVDDTKTLPPWPKSGY